MAPGPHPLQKVHEFDAAFSHLVLLCRNEEGYRNLSSWSPQAFLEGFYIKPRIDLDLLREHCGGLIACSACLGGEVPKLLMAGTMRRQRRPPWRCGSCLGRDGYYLELQDHGIPVQRQVNGGCCASMRRRASPDRHQRCPLPPAGGRRDAGHPSCASRWARPWTIPGG